MGLYVVFALMGLAAGAVYAGIGTSLLVLHRGTGVISFAHGALAMWATYVFDELVQNGDFVLPLVGLPSRVDLGSSLPAGLAACLAVGSASAIGLLAQWLIFRPLRRAPALAAVAASVGLMLTLQAVAVLRFGSEERVVPGFLSQGSVEIAGQTVPIDRFELAAIAILVAALMWAWFRFTLSGLATRAAAENERAASLSGFSPNALAAGAWGLSGAIAGLFGVLSAPVTGLNATNFTLFVVPALAVALVGRLQSLGAVCAAGLALGTVQSEIGYLQTQEWYPDWAVTGAGDALPFLVIVVALFLIGKRVPERGAAEGARLPPVVHPRRVLVPAAGLVVAGAIALLALDGSYRFGLVTSMIVAILILSIVVLTGFVGQISLAQAAFAGVGGFTLSKLADGLGLTFPFAPLLAASAAAALGLLVGLPALRIRGAQLAVVTLAAAVAIERFVFNNPSLTSTSGNRIPSPELLGLDLGIRGGGELVRIEFGLLVLAVLALVAIGVANLGRSATGRRFLAVRSNERAAASIGIDVAHTKLLAFVLSSFIAGLGGALIGYSRGQLSAESFGVFAGLQLLVFAYLGGITNVTGALIAGALAPLGIGYVVLDRAFDFGEYYLLFSGLSLIAITLLNPQGIAGTVREAVARPRPPPEEASPAVAAAPPPVPRVRAEGPVLELERLVVDYDGHRAVDGVSLHLAAGSVTGLIGPNGAGKTSLIDAVTGFVRYGGAVCFDGQPVDGLPSHTRADLGLARTWQSVEQFDDLSVIESLRVAAERPSAAGILADLVRPERGGRDGAGWALELIGLTCLASQSPRSLSLGQRKLAAVARALAANPKLVLLDEPAAGLDADESRALGERIRWIAEHGAAVLLVDHDVGLVLDVCDTIHVLDFGELIASGSPAEVRLDTRVIDAYLGATPAVEGARA